MTETSVNFAGVAFLLVAGTLMFVLPRRYAVLPILAMAAFMTYGQQLVIGGLHFYLLRVLILLGWCRLLARGELRGFRWNKYDSLILIWIFFVIVNYTLQRGTSGALVNRLGYAYNALGLYFMFRALVRNVEEMKATIRLMAVIAIPVALAIVVEKITAQNVFAVFGGLPAITEVRDGVIRAQAAFRHPILAGLFGATQLALFVGLWRADRQSKRLGALAIVAVISITIASGSSGPLLTAIAVAVALSMWPLRRRMRMVRWGIAAALILLHLVMKAPVWFLLARVNVFSGSTGWHRAHLIDKAVEHLDEWWLVGTASSGTWGFYLDDVTNEFLRWGFEGGLLTMSLFIAIIAFSFQRTGWLVSRFDKEGRPEAFLAWAVGSALFGHVVGFFSVSYFDQSIVNWYLLLGMISSASAEGSRAKQPQIARRIPARKTTTLTVQPVLGRLGRS